MITRNDILDALSKSTAYDSQHTPTPSRILVEAWLEHFQRYAPNVTRDDLLAVVTEYHREPRDRMLQPADLSTVARVIRRDQIERSPLDSPQRLALEARADAKATDEPPSCEKRAAEHRDRLQRVIAQFDPSDPDDAKSLRKLNKLTENPLAVKCPWCGALPAIRCCVPGTTVKLKGAHPSRIEAAEKVRANA